MIALLACLAAICGYYAWQHSRYEPSLPPEAHGRALADAAALAVVIGGVWAANRLGVRWGVIEAEGSAGATVGVIIGFLLAAPVRVGVLRALRLHSGGAR
jgi:hypothetical protein